MGVYAAETEKNETVQVSEIEDFRDLYSKTYETTEGTNVIISSAMPLHYEENGELKEIDNTLIKSNEDSSVLTNTANAYNVELPKKYTDNSEIKMDYEGYSISFKLIDDVSTSNGAIDRTNEIDVDKTNAESVAYAESNISNLSSDITYQNILPDTDFQYSVHPNALKENIILNDIPNENYSVQYELNTGSLTAILNEDNSISLVDNENNEIFLLEAPYMIDSTDNICNDVTVALDGTENGYILTYLPDYSWLSSAGTAYPVTIDPTVTIYGRDSAGQNIEDTFVTTTTKTKNKSTMTTVAVQNSSSESWGYYNIKTLPQLPENAKITNCTLNLFTTADVSTPYNLAMYALSDNASVDSTYISNVTWNNKIDPNDTTIDLELTPHNPGQMCFDITNLASKWYQNTDLNRILVVKALDSTLKTTIASSEYTINAEKIPYISLEYTIVDGINSDLQYHNQEAGLAGTAYINDYTGNLIVERTDFTSNGSVGDITLYMGNGVNTPENNCYGENTSINYYQTLTVDNLNDDSEYVMTKGDGSKEFISNGDKYTIDTSQENLIIVSYAEGENLVSDKFSSSVFSTNTGKSQEEQVYALVEYSVTKNAENDSVTESSVVTIDYNDDKIYLISDEVSAYEFSYDNGILCGINSFPNFSNEDLINEDCEGVAEIYTIYSINDDSLTATIGLNDTYNNEKNIEYVFSDKGNITRIIDEFGIAYEYTYNDSDQVIKVQEYSVPDENNNSVAGEYLTFDYGTNATSISDGTETYTEYFDLSGKLMSIVDQDGNAVFAQYNDNLISKISKTRNSARNIADFYGFESGNDSFFNTSNGYVNISSELKFNGNSSVELSTPAEINAIYTNRITGLESNSTYTVSMWLNKDEATNCSLILTNGDSNGIFTTVNSQNSEGWQQFYCTINTEDSDFLNVTVSVDNSNNTSDTAIYIDNMYIQKSPYLTNINLIENGDFSNSLNNWTNSSNTVVEDNANTSTADNNRLKLTGEYISANTVSQTVSIIAAEGTKYTFGGWIKAVDALPEKEGTNRELSLSVYAVSADGNTEELLGKAAYSTYYSDWKYIEDEITLPCAFGHDGDAYSSLKLVISYNYQLGFALVDGLSLSKDELYTVKFEYDEEGNITEITTNETTVSLTEEETADEASTYTDSYEYDDYGNIVKITETATVDDISKSIISKLEYDNNGSLLTKELGELGRWTKYGYDYFGNVASVTDANGNTVEYEYDSFQNLFAIINQFESNYIHSDNREDGSETAETYTLKVQYTYTGTRLDKIETGNIEDDEFTAFNTYSFEYDKWNNLINIYINDTVPYIHYEYDETNYNQLITVSYINGQEIHYVYDINGNIIYEYDTSNNNGKTLSYSYYYYNDGTCYGKKDLIAGTIESYQDGVTTVKNNDGTIRHIYGYDENGNLLEQIGNNYINVVENSSSIETTVNNSKNVFETGYDELGRVTFEKLGIEGSQSYILKEYTYYENDTDSDENTVTINDLMGIKNTEALDPDVDTTNLVRYLTYFAVSIDDESTETKTLINQYRYLYSYNGETLCCTVATDTDGQLNAVEEFRFSGYNSSNMLSVSSDYLYNYDSHGNISNVLLDRNEGLESGVNFTYDNNSGTEINNALTNIELLSDGTSTNFPVSYDSMGNIKDVGISELTDGLMKQVNLNWERGNTLDGITLEASNILLSTKFNIINYDYDDNNLRTHKSVNISGALAKAISVIGDEEIDAQDILSTDTEPIVVADMDYIWNNGRLSGEEIECIGSIFEEGDTTYGSGSGKYSIVILYDQNNNAYGLTVNKTEDANGNAVSESNTFYYIKDADNTINAIVDENGNKLVTYKYGSYGMLTDMNSEPGYKYLMLLNPLVYRDYVYDIETGMYYLQSRYYAPYIGRFISADNVLDTGSGTAMCTHLYSYCENKPVNNIDPTGNISEKAKNALTKIKNAIRNIFIATTCIALCNYYDIKIIANKVSTVRNNLTTIVSALGIAALGTKFISKCTAMITVFSAGTTAAIAYAANVLSFACSLAAAYLGLLNSRIAAHQNGKNMVIRIYKNGTFKINP